jgi:hypothetical protein
MNELRHFIEFRPGMRRLIEDAIEIRILFIRWTDRNVRLE